MHIDGKVKKSTNNPYGSLMESENYNDMVHLEREREKDTPNSARPCIPKVESAWGT